MGLGKLVKIIKRKLFGLTKWNVQILSEAGRISAQIMITIALMRAKDTNKINEENQVVYCQSSSLFEGGC